MKLQWCDILSLSIKWKASKKNIYRVRDHTKFSWIHEGTSHETWVVTDRIVQMSLQHDHRKKALGILWQERLIKYKSTLWARQVDWPWYVLLCELIFPMGDAEWMSNQRIWQSLRSFIVSKLQIRYFHEVGCNNWSSKVRLSFPHWG